MALQSRFGKDERFKMDSRFLEQNEDKEEESGEAGGLFGYSFELDSSFTFLQRSGMFTLISLLVHLSFSHTRFIIFGQHLFLLISFSSCFFLK